MPNVKAFVAEKCIYSTTSVHHNCTQVNEGDYDSSEKCKTINRASKKGSLMLNSIIIRGRVRRKLS